MASQFAGPGNAYVSEKEGGLAMNAEEIKAMRNVLAGFGFEHTPDEIATTNYIDKIEQIKMMFKRVQPHIEELKNKLDFGVIDMEFASELSHRFGRECTEDQCKHFLLLNSVFQYDDTQKVD